jgi:acyl-CoA thioester hydrolase
MTHAIPIRVYYEDTDLAGIVYYANYLRYIERARTEWIRDLGIDQTRLRTEAGMVFAVRKLAADYLRPAHFDDVLTVTTSPRAISGARIVLAQEVWRGETRLFAAEVTLVCLTAAGQPTRLPGVVRALFPNTAT